MLEFWTDEGRESWEMIPQVLSKSADRASELKAQSAGKCDQAGSRFKTDIFVFASQRNDGYEAEGKPLPRLYRVRCPVPTVVALCRYSLIALQLTREVCDKLLVSGACSQDATTRQWLTLRAHNEEERHGGRTPKG